ncbi:Zn-dependent proteases [Klebsiella pneumoniae]|nr:Zn-dependent proteases [Klebsiella pneumoniae]
MQHKIDKLVVGELIVGKAELFIGLHVFTQQIAHRNAHIGNQGGQRIARRRRFQIENNLWLRAAVADHLQRVARGAAGGVVVNGDVAHISGSLQCEGET